MITVARLKEFDKRKGYLMKSYTSYHTQTKYVVGKMGLPSPLRVIKHKGEIEELKEIGQFEILEFEDEAALREHIQTEMEIRARKGGPATRAEIIGDVSLPPAPKKQEPEKAMKPMAKAARVLQPLSLSDVEPETETGGEEDEVEAEMEAGGEDSEVGEEVTPEEDIPRRTKKKKSTKKAANKTTKRKRAKD